MKMIVYKFPSRMILDNQPIVAKLDKDGLYAGGFPAFIAGFVTSYRDIKRFHYVEDEETFLSLNGRNNNHETDTYKVLRADKVGPIDNIYCSLKTKPEQPLDRVDFLIKVIQSFDQNVCCFGLYFDKKIEKECGAGWQMIYVQRRAPIYLDRDDFITRRILSMSDFHIWKVETTCQVSFAFGTQSTNMLTFEEPTSTLGEPMRTLITFNEPNAETDESPVVKLLVKKF